MQHQNDTEKDDVGLNRVHAFMRSSTLFYLAMGGVGALVTHYQHHSLIPGLTLSLDTMELIRLASFSLMGVALLMIVSYLFEEQFPSYKAFRHILMQMVGAASIPSALYLALISAVGEELLFRGAIQPAIGLLGTAFIFGLLHLGPQGVVSVWTAWAVLSGLLLGWIYQITGNFWPVLICHFLVNAIAMLRLRIQYRHFLKIKQQREAGKKLLSGS